MMMAQGGVSLPAGYTKIEYLESDGNSYIDTGFKPNQDTRVVIDVQLLTENPTIYQGLFGARNENKDQLWVLYYYSNNSWAFRFGNNTANKYIPASGATDRVTIDVNANTMTIGGTSVTAPTSSFSSSYTMWLFAVNNAGMSKHESGPARLYSFKIYDNGTLVRDFIPAMNASGEAGLYDLKNDVWYALTPSQKPKVANKISTWIEFGDGVRYGVESQYPLASDVTVLYEGEERWAGKIYRYADSKVMSKGIQKTTAWEISRLILGDIPTSEGRTISAIISISPTEDDTYIYTF